MSGGTWTQPTLVYFRLLGRVWVQGEVLLWSEPHWAALVSILGEHWWLFLRPRSQPQRARYVSASCVPTGSFPGHMSLPCWQPLATAFVCGIESLWLRPADDAEGSLGKHGLDLAHLSEAQAPEMAGESGFSSWSGR